MKTIIKHVKCEYIIKDSKFISLCYHVHNTNEVLQYLKSVKNEYKNASHYCYAYIIDGIIKCSDDKEPSNTAGIVILNVLKRLDLNYTLIVIVRYFGGIKLGIGGLIRAYSSSAKLCLIDNIKEITVYKLVKISFNYETEQKIKNIISNCIIQNKNYNDKITYYILCTNNEIESLKNIVLNLVILDEKYIN